MEHSILGQVRVTTTSQVSCPRSTQEYVASLMGEADGEKAGRSTSTIFSASKAAGDFAEMPKPSPPPYSTFLTWTQINAPLTDGDVKLKPIEVVPPGDDHTVMNTMSREEVEQRIRVAEANSRAALAEFREEAAKLRSDLRAGNDQIGLVLKEVKSQGEANVAQSTTFYSKANEVLGQIKLAGEQNKTWLMSIGYKVLTWFFGAIVAIASVSLAVYKAVSAGLAG